MTDCPVRPVNGKWACPQCGWIHPTRKLDEARPIHNCTNAPSRGLGDAIEKILRKLNFKSCGGCKKRQAWLNRIFPYT